jgi:hypothetical protein
MKPRLQLKPKNKVRVSTSIRLVVAGAVFATLVAIGFLVYYNFGTSSDTWAVGESRFSGYNWRKKITFDRTMIQGDAPLINFPLLITLKDPDLRHISRGGKMIHIKGNDIRFSKSDGQSPLLSQIEQYNPETGELLAWVMLDTLSNQTSNSLYLYFSRADQPGTPSGKTNTRPFGIFPVVCMATIRAGSEPLSWEPLRAKVKSGQEEVSMPKTPIALISPGCRNWT